MNTENFSLGHNELALKDLSTLSTPVNTSKKKKDKEPGVPNTQKPSYNQSLPAV